MGLFQSKPQQTFGMAPSPPPPSRPGILTTLMVLVGAVVLGLVGYTLYRYIAGTTGSEPTVSASATSSPDQAPQPIDGKTRTVLPAAQVPIGSGAAYGLQFWMYIQDWDYRFGQPKNVLRRVAPNATAIQNPEITLHPTDNSLQVSVSIFPTGDPATGTSATGDRFTCTVENVPLQKWFAVSTTVFQRNLDIYIDGRLVKSCVLPGVPRPAVGDIILNDAGGFSGSLCNVYTYGTMLEPEDARKFFSAGTRCNAPAPKVETSGVDTNSGFLKLFGYTFKFSTFNREGKEVRSYAF